MPDLTEIGLEVEIWNSETDPGGPGEPAGLEDAPEPEEQEPEFDDDGEPVYRRRLRDLNSDPMPGLPRSSFAEWESGLVERSLVTQPEPPNVTSGSAEEAPLTGILPLERAERVCGHCRVGTCDSCRRAGRCLSCGEWIVPGHPEWRITTQYRPSGDFYESWIRTPEGMGASFVYTPEEASNETYIRDLIRRTTEELYRVRIPSLSFIIPLDESE